MVDVLSCLHLDALSEYLNLQDGHVAFLIRSLLSVSHGSSFIICLFQSENLFCFCLLFTGCFPSPLRR